MSDGGQYGEDALLLSYFQDAPTGFLVDVGAADGQTNSNSIRLLERGWSGLLVEPEPEQFKALQARWADRPDILCVQAACGLADGPATLYCAGQVSTLDPEWRDRCIQVHKLEYHEVQVAVVRLAALLDRCGAPATIDFLNVDCEGGDQDVLCSLDWARYRPRLVVVEDSGSYLAEQGYHQIGGTHGNRFWERNA